VWAWTEAHGAGRRLDVPAAGGRHLTDLVKPNAIGSRARVLERHRAHLELWPPANVLIEEADVRLVWCARNGPRRRSARRSRPACRTLHRLRRCRSRSPPSRGLGRSRGSRGTARAARARLCRPAEGGCSRRSLPRCPREWSGDASRGVGARELRRGAAGARVRVDLAFAGRNALDPRAQVEPGGPRFVGLVRVLGRGRSLARPGIGPRRSTPRALPPRRAHSAGSSARMRP
jgi:hypothetical protein